MPDTTRGTRITLALVSVALGVTILAGCSVGATPSATAPAATSTPTTPGPTAFADWIAREGFGGSSGLNNVNKLVIYLNEHSTSYALFYIDADAADVASLLAWLDAHPATACWTEYHAAVRSSLHDLVDGYAAVHAAVSAGRTPPIDVTVAMAATSAAAKALPAPANCP
jgi:hypothetical protein